jgi:hypothetical protein
MTDRNTLLLKIDLAVKHANLLADEFYNTETEIDRILSELPDRIEGSGQWGKRSVFIHSVNEEALFAVKVILEETGLKVLKDGLALKIQFSGDTK